MTYACWEGLYLSILTLYSLLFIIPLYLILPPSFHAYSGPRCGLGELILPENEPGSSIMPVILFSLSRSLSPYLSLYLGALCIWGHVHVCLGLCNLNNFIVSGKGKPHSMRGSHYGLCSGEVLSTFLCSLVWGAERGLVSTDAIKTRSVGFH